jgi:hypothetical protein
MNEGGGVAHQGERLPCKQEVAGSIPVASTNKLTERDCPGAPNGAKCIWEAFWSERNQAELLQCKRCGDIRRHVYSD